MARPSHVRDAIASLLSTSDRHDWTIEAIIERLHGDGVTADYSSAFRALGKLEQESAVRRVDLGDGKSHYEGAGTHHEHVRCESCGVVDEVPGCSVRKPVSDFVITGHQLLFSGLCPRCAA
ncbi:MAG TPA: transcriptional repressor [Baekduia sp.]|nr:transcriptional repressor [Baekduia sp.]